MGFRLSSNDPDEKGRKNREKCRWGANIGNM